MTLRLTAAQAMIRYLAAQRNHDGEALIPGCWAIFGHGNVAGIGEALYAHRETFPTYRGHNEQTMAHAAIAFAKAKARRQFMAVTTSIGPGATNMVTASAMAHVNRLPVLFIPGDNFAGRAPDPVLQQIEDFNDATVSANDCFRPVSAYFDRIMRPEQLLAALPRAMAVLTDPAACGPVTLAFCQDVQAEAFDWPEEFFTPKHWTQRRIRPDLAELAAVAEVLKAAKNPLIIAGGGVHYSGACEALKAFAEAHQIPVAETQSGKSALPWDHPLNLGAIGVTGTGAANLIAETADVVLGIGTRFQDFTTGSWALFKARKHLISLNVHVMDALKRGAMPLLADAREGLAELSTALHGWRAKGVPPKVKSDWFALVDPLTAPPKDSNALPTDQQVLGAAQRSAGPDTVVICAGGTMPGELHKLWKAGRPGSYHLEYGYSTMGYEIAGALGVKMADPSRDVLCMIGDGSYMMANSELATAAAMGLKITLVLTDNRGFGCISRLQKATGGARFNNLLADSNLAGGAPIDFAAHAASMGAFAVKVTTIAELDEMLEKCKQQTKPCVIVIETDPWPSTPHGGHWWDVAVPEVSDRHEVGDARRIYEEALKSRALT